MHYFSSTAVSPIFAVICRILYRVDADPKGFVVVVMRQYSREAGSKSARPETRVTYKENAARERILRSAAVMYYQ